MVIVFGLTGFIGRRVQRRLDLTNVSYIGFGRDLCIRRDSREQLSVVPLAALPTRSCLEIEARPKGVIFCAGTSLSDSSAAELRTSQLGSLQRAINSLPINWGDSVRFVYTSSALVYGRTSTVAPIDEDVEPKAQSYYAQIKLSCESIVEAATVSGKLDGLNVRLFNVAGPGQRAGIVSDVCRQAVEITRGQRDCFHLRSNAPILDIIDVRDVAEALCRLAVANVRSHTINVCTGRAVTVYDILSLATAAIGTEVPVHFDHCSEQRETLIGSPERLQRETGWTATIPLEQTIADSIAALKPKTT